jgi:hypothetical protein
MYQRLLGKELDQWAEARGIKRYQGLLSPDSDWEFKGEIEKILLKSKGPNSEGFIKFARYQDAFGEFEVLGRPIAKDYEGDFLFELHPDLKEQLKDKIPLLIIDDFSDNCKKNFVKNFPKSSGSTFFWVFNFDLREQLGGACYDGLTDQLPWFDFY